MKKGFEGLVRLGYLAKALVYILVGVLALRVAAGLRGGRLTDPDGALYVVLGQPFGAGMLFLVAVGLLTYAAWRVGEAILGRRRQRRASYLERGLTIVRALLYGAMGVQAMKLTMGLRGGESGPEPLVRAALQWPFGEWLILIAGIAVGCFGLLEITHAWTGKLDPNLDAATLRRRAGNWAVHLARGGIGARAVLLVLLAVSVVRAALARRASEAGGIDESLMLLNAMPQGSLLLGVAAAGVLAFGLYQLLHVRYANL